MLIIINGSIGVGKTCVSWELLDILDNAVMLDGDYFSAFSGYRIGNKSDLTYVFDALLHQMRFHIDYGFQDFIVNYVFTNESDLEQLVKGFVSAFDMPVQIYRLVCDPAIQKMRIRNRNNDQVKWELERMEVLNQLMFEKGSGSELGKLLDSSTLSPKEVATKIKEFVFRSR